jgi:hypothetical protein
MCLDGGCDARQVLPSTDVRTTPNPTASMSRVPDDLVTVAIGSSPYLAVRRSPRQPLDVKIADKRKTVTTLSLNFISRLLERRIH